MKRKLENIIKKSYLIRKLYKSIGSCIVVALGVFIKPDMNLILINSYGGKQYSDSPKAIYEHMIRDPRFRGYRFVWAFHDPQAHHPLGAEVVKTNSIGYFITALKSRCWISNSGIERGLSFKKPYTLYVNTWHGTPLKLMGNDIPGENRVNYSHDIQCAQSTYEIDIFSRAFGIRRESFILSGLPRNDELAKVKKEDQIRCKERLGLPHDKTVILYAPTFREYDRDKQFECKINPPINLNKWREKLKEQYVILFRAHYEIGNVTKEITDSDFIIDVTTNENINELMIASDMLVTDYSSVMFDYSITDKPIIIYAYDYEEYNTRRGMYFDIRDELYGGNITEDELINLITSLNHEDAIAKVRTFRQRYVTEYGSATEILTDTIYKGLTQGKML